eukprot:10019475-Lingulodinium_polyedra.AAC.1
MTPVRDLRRNVGGQTGNEGTPVAQGRTSTRSPRPKGTSARQPKPWLQTHCFLPRSWNWM